MYSFILYMSKKYYSVVKKRVGSLDSKEQVNELEEKKSRKAVEASSLTY